jgi:hypothetical protein
MKPTGTGIAWSKELRNVLTMQEGMFKSGRELMTGGEGLTGI